METNKIIEKYIKRIMVDYPEEDKIYLDLTQFANEIQQVKNLNIPDVSESLPIRYCQQCGEPLRRNKHKTWCEHYKGNVR